MPRYVAVADGVLTAAATWGLVDATSLLDSEVGNAALGTTYTNTAAFTPGAITLDGLAVKVASRSATPGANQIFVRLAAAGVTVTGTEVAIDVADLHPDARGWYFFKFAAPVTLLAATAYTLGARTTATTMVNLFRNATTSNWSRMLRTTTTAALVAGDDFFILGEWTGAGALTARAVTMDSTAATDYGTASTATPSVGVGHGGTLSYGTAGATAYVLRISGILGVWPGGRLEIGSAAAPIPRTSTAILEFDSAVNGDFGLVVWGSFEARGLSRSVGVDATWCLLAANAAAAATSLTVDRATGWRSGDNIGIASTTRTHGDAETRVLASDAGASTLAVTVGLTNAHGGVDPIVAEVINYSRDIIIQSVTTTVASYVRFESIAVVVCEWVLFRYLGHATAGKRGIDVQTTTGSARLAYCATADFVNQGISVAANSDNWSVEHVVGWRVMGLASGAALDVADSAGQNWLVDDLVLVGSGGTQGVGVNFTAFGGLARDIRVASCNAYAIRLTGPSGQATMRGVWGPMVSHSHAREALKVDNLQFARLRDVRLWRVLAATEGGLVVDHATELLVEDLLIFGCNGRNINLSGSTALVRRLTLRRATVAGDTSFATATGLLVNFSAPLFLTLDDCTFSPTSGVLVPHTTQDIDFGTPAQRRHQEIVLRHTALLAATRMANAAASSHGPSFIAEQRVNRATNVHRRDYPLIGVVSYETTTFRTAAPAEKLAPVSSDLKLRSGRKRVAIPAGESVNVGVWVRKDATYAGAAPRLLLLANPAVGVGDDTVLATFSAAADTWQQLIAATPLADEDGVFEFVVDCDGTAGAVFVDDWGAS